jgi:hypothetical protein
MARLRHCFETPKSPEPFSHKTHNVAGASLIHHPMKKVQMFKTTSKALLATAVATALVLGGVSASAFAADATPSATPAPTATATKAPRVNPNKVAMDAFRAAKEVFRVAQEQYVADKGTWDATFQAFKAAKIKYEEAKKVIVQTFTAAIKAANTAYAADKAAATTDEALNAAKVKYNQAIAAAAAVRSAAILALGAQPVNPTATKPVKPTKPSKPEHIDPAPKVISSPKPTASVAPTAPVVTP